MRTLTLTATPFVYLNNSCADANTSLTAFQTGGPPWTHFEWKINATQGYGIANNLNPNGFTLGLPSLPYIKAQYLAGSIHYYNPAPSPITFTFSYDEDDLVDYIFSSIAMRKHRDSTPYHFLIAGAGNVATSYAAYEAGGFNNIYEGSFWAYRCVLGAYGLTLSSGDETVCRTVGADRSVSFSVTPTLFDLGGVTDPVNPVSVTGYKWYWGDGTTPTDGTTTQSHVFSSSSTGVHFVGVDNYGRQVGHRDRDGISTLGTYTGPALRIAPRSIAHLNITRAGSTTVWDGTEPIGLDDGIVLDGTQSFDIDGSISLYQWYVAKTGTPLVAPGNYAGGAASLSYEFPEGGDYQILLAVRDANLPGVGYCSHNQTLSVTVEGGRPHAMSDHDGVAYIAWRTDGNVDILEYKDGRSTKRVLSTITNATPCALYRHESDSEVYLVTRDTATGVTVLQRSSDIGRTWTIMATLPLPNSDYKNQIACALSDGGHALAAIKRSDGFLYFSRSADGITWSTPARLKDASGNFLAITIGAKGLVMYEETASHSSRIVLTNNDSFMVSSDSTGASWANY